MVFVNGQEQETHDGVTVLGLLETMGVRPGRVAVEVNGAVVRRTDYARRSLADRDRIEVVHFVGGG